MGLDQIPGKARGCEAEERHCAHIFPQVQAQAPEGWPESQQQHQRHLPPRTEPQAGDKQTQGQPVEVELKQEVAAGSGEQLIRQTPDPDHDGWMCGINQAIAHLPPLIGRVPG
jgi:hypothetical protein